MSENRLKLFLFFDSFHLTNASRFSCQYSYLLVVDWPPKVFSALRPCCFLLLMFRARSWYRLLGFGMVWHDLAHLDLCLVQWVTSEKFHTNVHFIFLGLLSPYEMGALAQIPMDRALACPPLPCLETRTPCLLGMSTFCQLRKWVLQSGMRTLVLSPMP